MVFFLAIFLYVPSKDEIDERRADMAVLKKYPLQIRESDGETLVRIMTKNAIHLSRIMSKKKPMIGVASTLKILDDRYFAWFFSLLINL